MKTISVAGATSKAGKSLLAEQLIRYCAARHSPVCAVKFATKPETDTPFRIITDPLILTREETSTRRFLDAGAGMALWVTSSSAAVDPAYRELMRLIPDKALVVMEGSAVTSCCNPDLLFYVFAAHIPRRNWKESAAEISARSDFIVRNVVASESQRPELMSVGCTHSVDLSRVNIVEIPEIRDRMNSLIRSLQ